MESRFPAGPIEAENSLEMKGYLGSYNRTGFGA